MRAFAIAFAAVFGLGFGTALAFYELGTAAGLGVGLASLLVILLMSLIGSLIASGPAFRMGNLMEGAHYQVREGARYPEGFSDFFRTLAEIAPADSYLALAGGAWDKEVRGAVVKAADGLGDSLPALPEKFHAAGNTDEGVIPINQSTMDVFAKLADHHASPEIAMELGAFTSEEIWLEWFDATDDPIALSLAIPERSVERFADRIRGKWMACRWTDPAESPAELHAP